MLHIWSKTPGCLLQSVWCFKSSANTNQIRLSSFSRTPGHVLMKGFSGQCNPEEMHTSGASALSLNPKPLQKLSDSRYREAACQAQSGRYNWVCCMFRCMLSRKLSVSSCSVVILMSVCLYLMTYLSWSTPSFLKKNFKSPNARLTGSGGSN